MIVSHGLKRAVGRQRPRDRMAGVIVRNLAPGRANFFHVFKPPVVKVSGLPESPVGRGRSFPSSHVVNLFMFAAVSFRFRRWAG
ncbi:MAG TPA: hypothetical protein PLA50_11915, partial [Bacteroidia bacterium]|nr:hypothetical protein [Bacteroidia bacterium]